jgi:MSHA type pilus biogenesis protein MshL
MNKKILPFGQLIALAFLLVSCAPPPPPPGQQLEAVRVAPQAAGPATLQGAATPGDDSQLPVRFQRPNFLVTEPAALPTQGQEKENFVIPVGADISSTAGSVPLRDILRRLTSLKNMNVSWASDVDQYLLVDVDIRAEDDFFRAIDNLLRQVDYFHEVQGNTIIVKYKETRRYHIAMPFLTTTYNTGVGGNVLGGSAGAANIVGNIQMTSENNVFDIWDNIRINLNQILDIWSEPTPSSRPADDSVAAAGSPPPAPRSARTGKGYFSIDRPIGMITVTAPRPLLEKITSYLDNLKNQLYRQVSIEAKILEVALSEDSMKGIDWTNLLRNVQLDFQLFGPDGIIYSPTQASNRLLSQVRTRGSSPDGNPFSVVLDAIEQHGRTKMLANPKLSVMNGQPAMISVGENVRFIDSIEAKDNDGVVTYTAKTSSIMSGLGLSVVATIMDNDEIILSLTPVTSQLEPNMEKVTIGQGIIMLPRVRLREMNTLVRIKDGGMLVVGGLIDETDSTSDTKVPILGDIPMFSRLFKSEGKKKIKKELIILLRPQIISL